MKSLIIQIIIVSGILYGYYYLVLRNSAFHIFNRAYLVFSAVVSVVLIFLNIPILLSEQVQYFPASHQPTEALTQIPLDTHQSGDMNLPRRSNTGPKVTFILLYCFVTITFLVRFLIVIIRLIRLRLTHSSGKMCGVTIIKTNEKDAPFSFLNWIYWNNSININSFPGQHILKHELLHVKQKHSIDIILIEVLTAIFWINPFFHLIKRELKATHEFLADEYASLCCKKSKYIKLLLMQAMETNNRFVSFFSGNQLKRRISFIAVSKKVRYVRLRKLFVVPVTLIMIAVFAFSYKTPIRTIITDQPVFFNDLPLTTQNENQTKDIENNKEVLSRPRNVSSPGSPPESENEEKYGDDHIHNQTTKADIIKNSDQFSSLPNILDYDLKPIFVLTKSSATKGGLDSLKNFLSDYHYDLIIKEINYEDDRFSYLIGEIRKKDLYENFEFTIKRDLVFYYSKKNNHSVFVFTQQAKK